MLKKNQKLIATLNVYLDIWTSNLHLIDIGICYFSTSMHTFITWKSMITH
jgi:hypothetical protein